MTHGVNGGDGGRHTKKSLWKKHLRLPAAESVPVSLSGDHAAGPPSSAAPRLAVLVSPYFLSAENSPTQFCPHYAPRPPFFRGHFVPVPGWSGEFVTLHEFRLCYPDLRFSKNFFFISFFFFLVSRDFCFFENNPFFCFFFSFFLQRPMSKLKKKIFIVHIKLFHSLGDYVPIPGYYSIIHYNIISIISII